MRLTIREPVPSLIEIQVHGVHAFGQDVGQAVANWVTAARRRRDGQGGDFEKPLPAARQQQDPQEIVAGTPGQGRAGLLVAAIAFINKNAAR